LQTNFSVAVSNNELEMECAATEFTYIALIVRRGYSFYRCLVCRIEGKDFVAGGLVVHSSQGHALEVRGHQLLQSLLWADNVRNIKTSVRCMYM